MKTIELLLEILDMFVGFAMRAAAWLAMMAWKLLEIAIVVGIVGGILSFVVWGFWSVQT